MVLGKFLILRACERIGIAPSHLAPLAGRGRNQRFCARIPGEGNGALVLAGFCATVKRPLTPPLSPQAGRGKTLRLGSGKRPISSHALRRPRSGRLEGRTTPIQAIVDFLTASKAGIQICLGTGPLFAARGRLRRCDEGASFGCSVFPHQHALTV
jgi:hypothetical protein